MPRLKYKIGYIDLRQEKDDFFTKINCRTEIRRAQKSEVTVQIITDGLTQHEQNECAQLLKKLLSHERVPYDISFDQFLARKDVFHFLAYQAAKLVSFITVEPTDRNDVLHNFKTVYLALSATSDEAKRECPNYLLVWEATQFLKERGFDVFNLGLLEFKNCPDEAVSRVAFFKRKWNITEVAMEKNVNFGKWFYYHYLKRFKTLRYSLYFLKNLIKH